MLEIKLDYDETQELLKKGYVEFERDGKKYVFIFDEEKRHYILAEEFKPSYKLTLTEEVRTICLKERKNV